jgi:type IV pilus assembly protein PilN
VIRINLLPHRELKRAARQRQFILLGSLAVVAAIGVVLLGYGINTARIEDQNDANRLLKAEIVKLNKQLEEIKALREQTQALLARKQVVETLQANRAEFVHMLDQLVRQLPDGVYLKTVKQTGNRVNLSGYAQSSARVSTLMRNLDSSQWLGPSDLVEIKSAAVNNLRVNEFSLNVQIKHIVQLDDGKKTAAGKERKR